MLDSNTAEQLQALRKQLDQLEQEREARTSAAVEPVARTAAASKPAAVDPDDALSEADSWLFEDGEIDLEAILDGVRNHATDWFDEFNEDLKDTKPSTLLLVFGLGVLVGKLTN
jgi:hypothetical protein